MPLEPDEREVVLGDFAESGTTDGRALRDLLGLVARRQALAWSHWRPWLALAALVVPLCLAMSLVSRFWADRGAISVWFYVNNWTWGYLDSPGARRDLLHIVTDVCVGYLTLMTWSWTMGFVLGSLSRRTAWLNLTLFGVVLFVGTLGSRTMATANENNAAVFSLTFYRVAYPVMVRLVLVVLPAIAGLWTSRERRSLSLSRAVACALALGVLTALTARSLEGAVIFGWLSKSSGRPIAAGLSGPRLMLNWPLRLLPLAMAWPAVYIFATATWQSWRERTAPA
jgi:hypothetical protein